MNELLADYSLIGNPGNFVNIDIVATSIALFDASSKVDGEEATLVINLAKLLDSEKCHIGYRVFLQGKVESREIIHGKDLTWVEHDYFHQGTGKVAIPRGAVLHCFACYNGLSLQQAWLADPGNFQNPHRIVLEEFHDGLDILQSYLFDEQRRGRNARDFEFGVVWLLWMLGFSSAQVGGTDKTSDAADIVATTPSNNILIVECTTGLLKSDKIAKLVERVEIVKK